MFDDAVSVYNTVEEAVLQTGANASLVFVPPQFAADAIAEAVDAGIEVVISITEGVPVLDTIKVVHYAKEQGVILVGPNCPGLISPAEKCKVGIMPSHIYKGGRIGVVSRSGTLSYEAVGQLTDLGLGQSTVVGIGGDPVSGTDFVDVLSEFQKDDDTDAVVLIGEIGGTKEQEAAEYIKNHFKKPVVALVVGQSAPPGRRMGHAGAIVTGSAARADEKVKALRAAGAAIVPLPGEIGSTALETFGAN
jgi:succinyl-CoA synthetase alpha subunit